MISPGTKIGRWRITGEIGSGSFGDVYAVQCEDTGVEAALKHCHQRTTEAEVLDDLNHGGIPQLIECLSWNGDQAFVMDRIEGHSLSQILDAINGRHRSRLKVSLCSLNHSHRIFGADKLFSTFLQVQFRSAQTR